MRSKLIEVRLAQAIQAGEPERGRGRKCCRESSKPPRIPFGTGLRIVAPRNAMSNRRSSLCFASSGGREHPERLRTFFPCRSGPSRHGPAHYPLNRHVRPDDQTAEIRQTNNKDTPVRRVAIIPRICPTRVVPSPEGCMRPARISFRSLLPMSQAIGPRINPARPKGQRKGSPSASRRGG
jgi:hypothetical protein